MKESVERTKIVLRHLPPSLSRLSLMEKIEEKFAGRYNSFFFFPGKISQKNQRCSRAYVDFEKFEEVVEFAEFFDGHLFVNEKGIQFKVQVEYAPFQCIPKPWSKKDGREGTILKDPEYLEFLELLSKPVENLPSAEIQLERREAEKAGAAKEAPIVTPLMDFVRQKRAAKSWPQVVFQRISGHGKPSRRAVITGNCLSPSSKHGTEKRRGSTMYVSKASANNESGKEKKTYILRRDERHTEKSIDLPSTSRKEDTQVKAGTGLNGTISGVPVNVETGKKTVLLLKGKEHGSSHQVEAPGRIVRSILSNKERHQVLSQSDPQFINGNMEEDKHLLPPRPPVLPNTTVRAFDGKSFADDQVDSNGPHASICDNKHNKRMRNKDRPDRGVWAPLRRSDGSRGRGTKLLSANEIPFGHGELNNDSPNGNRNSDFKSLGGGRASHVGRRGTSYGSKEFDSSATMAEGKPLKRGPPCYGSHEKQVWVQKAGSAT